MVNCFPALVVMDDGPYIDDDDATKKLFAAAGSLI